MNNAFISSTRNGVLKLRGYRKVKARVIDWKNVILVGTWEGCI